MALDGPCVCRGGVNELAVRSQLPIGTGGVALRYQRSSRVGVRRTDDLNTEELFAFAPTAHDAASLVQRLFRRVKRKKWR